MFFTLHMSLPDFASAICPWSLQLLFYLWDEKSNDLVKFKSSEAFWFSALETNLPGLLTFVCL